MGAIKLECRLPPSTLPEHDPEDLLDIEEEESPLPPRAGSIPSAPNTAKSAGATTEREQQLPPPKHHKPNPLRSRSIYHHGGFLSRTHGGLPCHLQGTGLLFTLAAGTLGHHPPHAL
jgi:hypothetical protein